MGASALVPVPASEDCLGLVSAVAVAAVHGSAEPVPALASVELG